MDDLKRFEQLTKWSAKQKDYKINPELNVIDVTPQPLKFGFKYKMPLGKRIDLFLMSAAALMVSGAILFAICFVLYSFVESLFQ